MSRAKMSELMELMERAVKRGDDAHDAAGEIADRLAYASDDEARIIVAALAGFVLGTLRGIREAAEVRD